MKAPDGATPERERAHVSELVEDLDHGRSKYDYEQSRENKKRHRDDHLEWSRRGLPLRRMATLSPQCLGRDAEHTRAARAPLLALHESGNERSQLIHSRPIPQSAKGVLTRHAGVGLPAHHKKLL